MVVWATPRLFGCIPPALQSHLLTHTACLAQFSTRELMAVLVGLAHLKLSPGPKWKLHLYDQLYWTCDQFYAHQLSCLLWCLAVLRCEVPLELRHHLIAFSHLKMKDMKGRELVMAGYAIARMRWEVPRWWLLDWLSSTQELFQHLSPQGLALCLWCVLVLGVNPGQQWMNQLCAHLEASLPAFSRRTLEMMARALSVVRSRVGMEGKEAMGVVHLLDRCTRLSDVSGTGFQGGR